MKNMKKKFALLVTTGLVAVSAYAGIAYIDYNTGKYGCNNSNFESSTPHCQKNSSYWKSYQWCQQVVSDICDPY